MEKIMITEGNEKRRVIRLEKPDTKRPKSNRIIQNQMRYRHFKGGIYKYICDATLEWCPKDPNSHVIVYQGEDGRRWVRPRNEFFGYTKEGKRRFEKIE